MDLGAILHDLLFDYTLRTVALGAAVLGLVSGALLAAPPPAPAAPRPVTARTRSGAVR